MVLKITNLPHEFPGKLNDGVFTSVKIFSCKSYLVIRFDAELGEPFVLIKHRASREPHAPTVGQFARERQSRSTACAIAHRSHVRTTPHIFHELIGCREDAAVGQHHDRLLPSNAFSRFQNLLFQTGEVIVSSSRLVLYVTHEPTFIRESCSQLFSIGERTSTIVAYIYDYAFAWLEKQKDIVEVSRSHTVLKT